MRRNECQRLASPSYLQRRKKESRLNKTTQKALSKVPEVTLGFWIFKIFATTLGEVGGNAVTLTLGLD